MVIDCFFTCTLLIFWFLVAKYKGGGVKKLKIQALVSCIILLIGAIFASSKRDATFGGSIGLADLLPALVGAIWLFTVMFLIWYKRE